MLTWAPAACAGACAAGSPGCSFRSASTLSTPFTYLPPAYLLSAHPTNLSGCVSGGGSDQQRCRSVRRSVPTQAAHAEKAHARGAWPQGGEAAQGRAEAAEHGPYGLPGALYVTIQSVYHPEEVRGQNASRLRRCQGAFFTPLHSSRTYARKLVGPPGEGLREALMGFPNPTSQPPGSTA